MIWLFHFSQSVTSSPALSRKSSKTNIKTSEELGPGKTKTSLSNLVYDCDKSFQVANDSSRVSEDINDMVEQIQAIQNDISELAGRPISLIDYKQWTEHPPPVLVSSHVCQRKVYTVIVLKWKYLAAVPLRIFILFDF